MMALNRSTLSILLLACMVVPSAGALTWLFLQKQIMKTGAALISLPTTEKGNVVLLKLVGTIAQARIKWEHDREFSLEGEMYDVLERKISDDTAYYWCQHDKKETWLNKQLRGAIEEIIAAHPVNAETASRILFCYGLFFLDRSGRCPILVSRAVVEQKAIFYFLMRLTSHCAAPQKPPPKTTSANGSRCSKANAPSIL